MLVTVLRGVPGSGKSYIGERLAMINGGVVISSDKIRAELYGAESTQGDPGVVFFWVRSRIAEALMLGHDVIVDATNIQKTAVDQYIAMANCFGAKSLIVEVHTDLQTCFKRNAQRERRVPIHVIQRMYDQLDTYPVLPGKHVIDWYANGQYVELE